MIKYVKERHAGWLGLGGLELQIGLVRVWVRGLVLGLGLGVELRFQPPSVVYLSVAYICPVHEINLCDMQIQTKKLEFSPD